MKELKEVYLDNSATTKTCEEAISAIDYMLRENYGNPSSLHSKGILAEKELSKSRKKIADVLKCDEREVYFTSGGTEANNLAVFGSVYGNKKKKKKIIITSTEHSSVKESAEELKKRGFELIYIEPNENGQADIDNLYSIIDDEVALVSIMHVNNEIGSINDILKVRNILNLKKSEAIFHVDAVQSFGKIDVNVKKIGADLVSISSHKIHGPKGVGALYIKRGTNIKPMIFGGEQEKRIRPGTESAALISGFSAAIDSLGNMKENFNHILELNNYLRTRLKEIPGVVINSAETMTLPYICNFSTCKVRSETMLHFLAEKNIYVSSGSACAKGKMSHVLKSMNLDKNVIDTAIRVSFSRYNDINDVDVFIEGLKEGISKVNY